MAPRLALLKAALCLAALHAHCATAYATENCVVCGDDETTRCKCSGCDGKTRVSNLVTVNCRSAGIVSLAPQPINDTLPEGTEFLCVTTPPPSPHASACPRGALPRVSPPPLPRQRRWRRAPTDALRRAAPPTHSLTHSFALALAPRDAPQGT